MTSKPIRVIQYGLGAMGGVMAKMLLEKKGLSLVGAIVHDEKDAGKDVAELIGIKKKTGVIASSNAAQVFNKVEADIVLHATVSYFPRVWEQIAPAVRAGLNIVTIAEEMGYPFKKYPSLSAIVDREAKKYSVSILGTGINPGFAMDILPLMLSGICHTVKKIHVKRLVNFMPFGKAIQQNIGIGMTPAEFKKRVKMGKLPLHIGLPESLFEMADALGWKIRRITEKREPVLAQRAVRVPGYKTVAQGHVVGFNHRCFGYENGHLKIVLEELGNVMPGLKYQNTIEITGVPNLLETMNVPMGNLTTTSHAINVVPWVVKAKPGLLSMKDLPIVSCLPSRSVV